LVSFLEFTAFIVMIWYYYRVHYGFNWLVLLIPLMLPILFLLYRWVYAFNLLATCWGSDLNFSFLRSLMHDYYPLVELSILWSLLLGSVIKYIFVNFSWNVNYFQFLYSFWFLDSSLSLFSYILGQCISFGEIGTALWGSLCNYDILISDLVWRIMLL
jgi:hypothetical protein